MEATPEPQIERELEQERLPETTASYSGRIDDAATDRYFPSPFEAAPGLEALSTAAASNYDYMQPVCLSVLQEYYVHPYSSKLCRVT